MGCGGAFGKRFAAAQTPTLQILVKKLDISDEVQRKWFKKFETVPQRRIASIAITLTCLAG